MQDKQFLKCNRLRKSAEFKKVFDQGRKVVTMALIFHVLRTDLEEPRLGLAVSRKVGNAVVRNKIKRRIREAFRDRRERFPHSVDIVAYPRRGIHDKGFEAYLESFDMLLTKMSGRRQRHEAPRKS